MITLSSCTLLLAKKDVQWKDISFWMLCDFKAIGDEHMHGSHSSVPSATHEQHIVLVHRHGNMGDGRKRMGENTWLRLTERWTPTAKSVFGFGVQGEVATLTHAGLPWLLYLKKECRRPIHFWPFDGWEVQQGRSVVAEVYSSLWTRRFSRDDRDGDEEAA